MAKDSNFTPPQVDQDQLELFRSLIFKHAPESGGIIPIRAFLDDATSPELGYMALDAPIEQIAHWAQTVAGWEGPWVYCPPLVLTMPPEGELWRAREQDVEMAFCLSVEIDDSPQSSLARLVQLLGQPTVLVASGGITKQGEDKLHAHWRLSRPADSPGLLADLKWARRLAQRLVNADASNIPTVHPIRWPGSIHKKGVPRLCRIIAADDGIDIHLQEALNTLRDASPGVQRPTTFTLSDKTKAAPSDALAVDLMRRLDNQDLDWEEWNRIGMQLFASTGGSDAGLEAWRQFSEKSGKNDPRATELRWEHYFRSPPTQTGWPALRARVPGYIGPEDDLKKLRAMIRAPCETLIVPDEELTERLMLSLIADIGAETPEGKWRVIRDAMTLFGIPVWHAPDWLNKMINEVSVDIAPPFEPGALYEANDVLNYEPGPVNWMIHEAVAEGLTMFVGAMKTGKSFLLLQAMEAITTGQPFLGRAVKRGKVLYYGIEDGRKRIARRIRQMGLQPDGSNLRFRFDGAPNPDALRDMIEADLKEHPDTVMVIIDTLKIASGARPDTRKTAYDADVEMLRPFVKLAHEHGVAIVATAHERKPKPGSKAEADPFNAITGSAGIPATADGLLRLTRIRKERMASLYIGGRDVTDEQEVSLTQKVDGGGRFTPTHEVLVAHMARMALMRSGCPKDIQELLVVSENYTAHRDGIRAQMKLRGHEAGAVQRALHRLREDGVILESGDEITLVPPSENDT